MRTRAQPSATLPGPDRVFTTLPLVALCGGRRPPSRANHMGISILAPARMVDPIRSRGLAVMGTSVGIGKTCCSALLWPATLVLAQTPQSQYAGTGRVWHAPGGCAGYSCALRSTARCDTQCARVRE
eukprot:scaffold32393_cov126-Isochrysis_galbana.AAC.3